MTSKNQQLQYSNNNILGLLAGVFVGGLAGAVTMLLLAPQSGEDTRSKIQEKSIELRDRTTDMIEGAVSQMRIDSNQLTKNGREKAKELLAQGQMLVIEQLDHVSDAAMSGKQAILAV